MRRGPVSRDRSRRWGEHTTTVDESRFCGCGLPFLRIQQSCVDGHPVPRRQLRVREVDGQMRWVPVVEAVRRGGR
jgi:hypothetical protein